MSPTLATHEATLVDLALLDDNPYQPRQRYDTEKIAAIAASITIHGLLQLPVGRQLADGRVQLAFAHSRRRAYDLLAQADRRYQLMPVILRDLDDQTMALHAWTENKDRADLTAYEEARAIERYTTAFGWSQAQAADRLGLDRSTVSNKLRLLKLPQAALAQLEAGALSERQAMALLPLAELPTSLLTKSASSLYVGKTYIRTPTELLAVASELDSAALRKAIEDMIAGLTQSLAKADWAKAAVSGVEVHTPLCKDCPIRLKSNRCPDSACADRKIAWWGQRQAVAAAAAADLPTVAAHEYSSCDSLDGVNITKLREVALKKRCGTLGVCYDPDHHWWPHKVAGFPGCLIICAHGRGKRCGCKQSLNRGSDPTASKDAQKKHDRARIRAELQEPAEAQLRGVLSVLPVGLARLVLERVNWSSEQKLPQDAGAEVVRGALAAALVTNALAAHYDYTPDYAHAKRDLMQLLTRAGAAIPWQAPPPPPPPGRPLADVVAAQDSTALAAAAVVRGHLASARQLVGANMAWHFLDLAREALTRVASENLDLAVQVEAEIADVAVLLRATEADEADVCAQTTNGVAT